jgi:NurA-like 5'-3' nuclease
MPALEETVYAASEKELEDFEGLMEKLYDIYKNGPGAIKITVPSNWASKNVKKWSGSTDRIIESIE